MTCPKYTNISWEILDMYSYRNTKYLCLEKCKICTHIYRNTKYVYLEKYKICISREIQICISRERQNMYSGCFDIPCQKYCRPGPAGTETPSLLILSENFNNPPYTWQIYLQSIIQLYKYITEFEKYQYMANISTNTNIYLYTNILSTNISANIYAKYDY